VKDLEHVRDAQKMFENYQKRFSYVRKEDESDE
jgi:hypothetical protein